MRRVDEKSYVPSRSLILGKLIKRNIDGYIVNTPEGKLWLAVLQTAFRDTPDAHEQDFLQSRGFVYICNLLSLDPDFVSESVARYDMYAIKHFQ